MNPASPLNIPERRIRISRCVSIKDAIACAQVCKDWSDVFQAIVWYDVNPVVLNRHGLLHLEVIARHAHHIRAAWALREPAHFQAFHSPSLRSLKSLKAAIDETPLNIETMDDLLRQNHASLVSLTITNKFISGDRTQFSFNTMCSKLTSLNINGLAMNQSFSEILQLFPLLERLSVDNASFTPEGTPLHQHLGVRKLASPIDQIVQSSSGSSSSLTFFAHLPSLQEITVWRPHDPEFTLPEDMGSAVTQCCPLLNSIVLLESSDFVIKMLTQRFNHMREICVSYQHLTHQVAMSIVSHMNTLEKVSTFQVFSEIYENDWGLSIGDVYDKAFQETVLVIPTHCHQLKELNITHHQLDMDMAEQATWACSDLETLCIKIRDLDTVEHVERTLQMWVDGRDPVQMVDTEMENSLEARVARHLLRFKNLRQVWLGCRMRRV
ncbi:hypothetical protein EDD21DRAFT_361704 [Dissophora ornata]|nr:hypothetical protein EDD21DRAFT_361704 [Dissophora ornata]